MNNFKIRDLGAAGILPTAKALNEKEVKFFEAFFKNEPPQDIDNNKDYASRLHDWMDGLKALDHAFLEEFSQTQDFVEVTQFDTEEGQNRLFLVMLSDAELILRRIFAVEFFPPEKDYSDDQKYRIIIRKKVS